MLANGATLGYMEGDSGSSYTDLPGLMEIPDLGVDPEKVDVTVLTAKNKQYEIGIGDLPEMTYKFKYDRSNQVYTKLKEFQEAGKPIKFQEKLKDGTTATFSATPAVKLTGGGVNAVIQIEATLVVASDIAIA